MKPLDVYIAHSERGCSYLECSEALSAMHGIPVLENSGSLESRGVVGYAIGINYREILVNLNHKERE
jgi:hypothetical protein